MLAAQVHYTTYFMGSSNNLLLLLITGLSHHLPGLGVLAMPESPGRLPFSPHTALMVKLDYPAGHSAQAVATVEEVSRAGLSFSALLVQLEEQTALPPGTRIWLADSA